MPFSTSEDLVKASSELQKLGPAAYSNSRALLQYLRVARELGVSNCEQVLEYGSAVLSRYQNKMDLIERWQLHEDVAVAAFTCGQPSVGQQILKKLDKKFPNSHRVQCLKGMGEEAIGNFDKAEELYDNVLSTKPTFPEALKRKIGLSITRGNMTDAISAATQYLDIYQTDHAIWEQLHFLYLQAGQLSQAQYCLEECLLHVPASPVRLLRLADSCYAQGNTESIMHAYMYYARTIELTGGDSVRALYGLLASKNALIENGAVEGLEPEMVDLSSDRLMQLYSDKASDKRVLVETMIEEYTAK